MLDKHGTRENNQAEIDLSQVLAVLLESRNVVFLVFAIVFSMGAIYAFSLQNVYTSKAVLAFKNDGGGSGLAQLASSYGALAGLAGTSLGGGDGDREANIALEIVNSYDFFQRYLHRSFQILSQQSFEKESAALAALEEAGEVVESTLPQDDFLIFQSRFGVQKESVPGIVTFKFTHSSPITAKVLLDIIVSKINYDRKESDILEAEEAIAYLTEQSDKTNILSVSESFAELIEEQTKTLMLANVGRGYVFETIEPPVVEIRKSGPNRRLILFVVALLGIISGVLVAFFKKVIENREFSSNTRP